MKPIALIGFADSLSAQEVTWSLHDAGYEVIAFAKRGRRGSLGVSRYATTVDVTDPSVSFTEAGNDIEQLATNLISQRTEAQIVLIPLDDASLYLSNRIKAVPGLVYANPPVEIASLALDKWDQTQLAKESGFNAIETKLVKHDSDPSTIQSPCILKPRLALDVQNDQVVKGSFFSCQNPRSVEESLSQISGHSEYIAQPFVAGVGEGIFGVATSQGVQAISGHRRVRMMNPEGSGSSACKSINVDNDLEHATHTFIEKANWSGLFMIELIRDSSGKAWFMEFNGRPWGSMALARRQNFEYPAWHANLATGRGSCFFEGKPDLSASCRHIGRELIHFLFVLRGQKKGSNTVWPKTFNTLQELSLPQAARHWYNFRLSDPLPLFADTASTVKNAIFNRRRKST